MICFGMVAISVYAADSDSEIDLTDNQSYEGGFVYFSSVPKTLFLMGDIGKDVTGARGGIALRRAIRNHDISNLVLISGGGRVDFGLEYAAIIHDKNIDVYVPKDAYCYSACSYIFFGGNDRYAEGEVGVHQFYANTDREDKVARTQQSAQFGVSDIIAILNSFDVPPRIYEHMFGTVGSDMYILKKDELSELGVGERRAWHDVDKLLAVISKEMADDKPDQVIVSEPEPQVTEQELVRRAFVHVQTLLNEHNCGAGTPDGIVGPKTEAAFERFVRATGVSINFDADNAFEQVINALESQKKPACGNSQTTKPAVVAPKERPNVTLPLDGQNLLGDWAILQRCQQGTDTRILRGQATLTNMRRYSKSIMYDVFYIVQNKDRFYGSLTEKASGRSTSVSISLSGDSNNSNYRGRLTIENAELDNSRDAISIEDRDFKEGRSAGRCTLDAYRIKQTSTLRPSKKLGIDTQIQITFKGSTSVSVTDSDGTKSNEYVTRGEVLNVEGSAPVSLVIGNAYAVKYITVNGSSFNLDPYVRNGVARFTLGR